MDGVEDLRVFLRMETGVEQLLLERLVGSAVALGEAFTGTPFVQRVVEEVVDGGGWRRLLRAPVVAITSVMLLDGSALAADAYSVDIGSDGTGWVRTDVAKAHVGYVAGLAASWAEVPAAIAHGVTALAAHLFEHREGDAAPPAAVAALWRPYRRLRLGHAMRPWRS